MSVAAQQAGTVFRMTPDGNHHHPVQLQRRQRRRYALRQPAARQRWPFLWRRERRRQRRASVFAITASGALTTLQRLQRGGDGTGPVDTLVRQATTVISTCVGGGGYQGYGSLQYRPARDGRQFTTLHLFTTRRRASGLRRRSSAATAGCTAPRRNTAARRARAERVRLRPVSRRARRNCT